VISAERVERPQGHAWHVFLERADVTAAGSDVTTNEPAATRQSEPAPAASHVVEGERLALALAPLVEAAVAPFRGELADVRAHLSARDQEVGQLREWIRLLEALPAPSESRQEAPTANGVAHVAANSQNGVETTQVARTRPWWRFW
jgi:hypothetical protein